MPVAQSVQLPLPLSQLEQYALAASTDERLRLLSQHVDVNSDDWHYLQLLAWQTADMQHFQQPDNVKRPANTPSLHCTTQPYVSLLAAYKQRFAYSSQLRTIQLRHDLLTFLLSPAEQQQQIINKISRDYANIDFNHTPHTADDSHTAATDEDKHDYPTRLDPALVQLDRLITEQLDQSDRGIAGFTAFPLAIDAIARLLYSRVVEKQRGKKKENDTALRDSLAHFLSQSLHPAVPQLLNLVLYDLQESGKPFGDRAVHRMLPLSDLVELSKRWPDIEQQQNYVLKRLERMQPDGGLEWLTVQQKTAFYDEVVAYVKTLSDAHFDIKANTIYHALAFKLQQGVYDDELFYKHYLALPLPFPLVRPTGSSPTTVNLHYGRGALFPPAQERHNDLIVEYVQHYFAQQLASDRLDVDDTLAFDRIHGKRFERNWLREQCAMAQLQTNENLSATAKEKFVGWWKNASLATERHNVLLSFLPNTFASNSPPSFTANEEMNVTMTLKNVGSSLLVKVYRVASTTYYRLQGKEIDVATFNLEGVVAHHEETITLPAYSVYHKFSHTLPISSFLPSPTEHGVFIVEVTAQGKKVRALLRRGALTFLSEPVPAGIVVKVISTDVAVTARNTRVYVGGHEYVANDSGLIMLPYLPIARQNVPIVLTASDDSGNEYSSLATFEYKSEQYSLCAAVHVDMETLLAGSQSETVLRATLALHDRPLPLSQLQRVRLHIRTVHGDDVSSTQVVDDVQLDDAGELVHPFTVPLRLRSIHVTLEGEMLRQSVNDSQRMKTEASITISTPISEQDGGDEDDNSLRESLDDLYLRYGSDGYGVLVLGKAGEAIPRRTVFVQLQHRYLSEALPFTLQTDSNGIVLLGELRDIKTATVSTRTGGKVRTRSWEIASQQQSSNPPLIVHAREGETVTIAYPSASVLAVPALSDAAASSVSDTVALFRLDIDTPNAGNIRSILPVESHVQLMNGYVSVKGLEQGRYLLLLKAMYDVGLQVHILVAPSSAPLLMDVYTVYQRRVVQLGRQRAGASIAAVLQEQRNLVVHVAHATATSRLHITAAHFVPTTPLSLARVAPVHSPAAPRKQPLPAPINIYLSQADLGDESRYILDRRLASKRVGNMLAKPTLLNNELERRGTSFDDEPELRQGGAYQPVHASHDSSDMAQSRGGATFAFASTSDDSYEMNQALSSSIARPTAFFAPRRQMAAMVVGGGMMRHRKLMSSKQSEWESAEQWDVSAPANVDFLSSPSLRLWNVRVGEGGRVELPLDQISAALSHLDIVVLDDREGHTVSHVRYPLHSLTAQSASAASPMQVEEQKQNAGQDGSAEGVLALHPHYSDVRYSPPNTSSDTFLVEQSLVSPLQPGSTLTIEDRQSASVAIYESIDDLYHLLHTLASSRAQPIATDLTTFDFLLRWPTLTDSQKRVKYSEFACHELHLFLYQRDRPFFTSIVLPFLREKQTPTLFDRVLLGESVSDWLTEPRWSALNVLEQAMVGRRCAELGETEAALRVFRFIEQRGLAAKNVSAEEEARLFDTALSVKSLSAEQNSDDGSMEDDEEAEEEPAANIATMHDQKKEKRMGPRSAAEAPEAGQSVNDAGLMSLYSSDGSMHGVMKATAFGAAPTYSAAPQFSVSQPAPAPVGSMYSSATAAPAPPPRRVYSEPPLTMEYQERNYWAVTIDHSQHTNKPGRVNHGQFWIDYARYMQQAGRQTDSTSPPTAAFLPSQLTSSLSSFTDAMAALSIIDLPFSTDRKPAGYVKQKKSAIITANTPIVVYRKVTQPANRSPQPLITVTTHYFDRLDRYVDSSDTADDDEGSSRRDKYVTEFTPHRTYTCRVVLFNPSPARRRVRVLQQIPHGSISVAGGQDSRTGTVQLNSVSSRVMEFSFYFPAVGSYLHQAIQVSHKQLVVGHSDAITLPVRHKSALAVDLTSWSYLAASGSDQQVIEHLKQPATNWERLDLSLIAWRWRQRADFWRQCVALARERLTFDPLLFAYSAHHKDLPVMSSWLTTINSLVSAVGPSFASPLLHADSEDEWYDGFHYLEYRPLIASRAHQLRQRSDPTSYAGKDTSLSIQNKQLREQYKAFLTHVAFRYAGMGDWDDKHKLQLCYYLLLQDRLEEAQTLFQSISQPAHTAAASNGQVNGAEQPNSLHYDYMAAYLNMYTEPSLALSIAKRYQQYPISKKRKLFEAIEAQLAEITTKRRDDLLEQWTEDGETRAKPEDANVRDAEMDKLAATEPSLDFALSKDGIDVTYANVAQIKLSMYAMDLELLFSSNPFLNSDASTAATSAASSSSSSFLYLVPNEQLQITLPPSAASATSTHTIPLPPRFLHSNLLVSVSAGSLQLTKPLYSHGLSVSLIEQFGQLKATARSDGRPLSRVYVKVYAKGGEGGEGHVSFYKDGYTDWRGRFDYASLSTQRLGKVKRFAILLQSDTEGAVVKEAKPPNKS